MNSTEYHDALAPTRKQIKSSQYHAWRREAMAILEIVFVFILVIVMPVVIFAGSWWWVANKGGDTWSSIFGAVGATCTYLMGVGIKMGFDKGKVIVPEDLEMFHCSELPLSDLHQRELEIFVERFPQEAPRVEYWMKQHDGVLRLRHLWELRRCHVGEKFTLGVVEVCEARTLSGRKMRPFKKRAA